MTRDRSLETSVLLQDILVVLAAMLLSRGAHAGAGRRRPDAEAAGRRRASTRTCCWSSCPPGSSPPIACGIHRLQTLTGEKLEIVRRVILTQAWGVAAIGLILTFAQVSLNRSLILVFLVLSTALLLVAKAVQAPWLARRRGQSRVLLIGDASDEMAGEFERLRGRHVERWTGQRSGGARGTLPRRRRRRGGAGRPPAARRRCSPTSARARRPASPCSCRVPLEPQSLPLPAAGRRDRRQQRLRRLPAAQAGGAACWRPRRSSIACWRRC